MKTVIIPVEGSNEAWSIYCSVLYRYSKWVFFFIGGLQKLLVGISEGSVKNPQYGGGTFWRSAFIQTFKLLFDHSQQMKGTSLSSRTGNTKFGVIGY